MEIVAYVTTSQKQVNREQVLFVLRSITPPLRIKIISKSQYSCGQKLIFVHGLFHEG
jgi:hypothetical protein